MYEDKIKDLEDEVSKTKYNKRTQHHIGLVKAKLAKLKEKQVSRGGGGGGEGYAVRKSGDATVVLLGFPSVGKSTLLNALTDAESEVGAYAFTTLTVVPGLLEHQGAKIQILDVPGIVNGAAAGTGRGKEVLAVLRSADLVLMLIDPFHPGHLQYLKKEVYDTNIRIDKTKPDVKIVKKSKDGIKIGRTVKCELTDETITDILKEFRINNADVVIRSPIDVDELIDVIESNKVYIPSITVLAKSDMINDQRRNDLVKKLHPNLVISAHTKENIPELKQLIFDSLSFMRIYMKEPGKPADLEVPLIVKIASSVEDVCRKIHKDFVRKFKYCKVTGPSAKFPNQKLALKHVLKDGDILEIHIR